MPDPELFDEAWVASFGASLADLPARPGASAVVSAVVTGGPGGRKAERPWHFELVDGRVVTAGPGAATVEGERVLALTLPWDDAVAALRGEVPVDEAFMRGSTKVVGSMGVFMDLLPVLRSDEWQAACAPLAGAG